MNSKKLNEMYKNVSCKFSFLCAKIIHAYMHTYIQTYKHTCVYIYKDKWKERLQSFATISLHASIVQWNSQETLESDFLSSKHGRGSS